MTGRFRDAGELRDWLWKQGRVSEAATMRAMARNPKSTEQALVELKGVDAAYPLATVDPDALVRLAERVARRWGR